MPGFIIYAKRVISLFNKAGTYYIRRIGVRRICCVTVLAKRCFMAVGHGLAL
jgi:hypothetical protein